MTRGRFNQGQTCETDLNLLLSLQIRTLGMPTREVHTELVLCHVLTPHSRSQPVHIVSDVGQIEETDGGLEVPLGMRVLRVAPVLARVDQTAFL